MNFIYTNVYIYVCIFKKMTSVHPGQHIIIKQLLVKNVPIRVFKELLIIYSVNKVIIFLSSFPPEFLPNMTCQPHLDLSNLFSQKIQSSVSLVDLS